MRSPTLVQNFLKIKYVCSGICLFLAGIILIYIGYQIRDNEWGKHGWAMILGILLLCSSFLLFLTSLIRKMNYQLLRENRNDKTKDDSETKLN